MLPTTLPTRMSDPDFSDFEDSVETAPEFPALESIDVPITLDEIGMRLSALEEQTRVNSTKVDEVYKGVQWLCGLASQGMQAFQSSPMAQGLARKFIGGK